MDEDRNWVLQVLDGNKQAYAHLITKYKDRIYNVLYRMVHSREEAKDLTQECFIKAFQKLASYDLNRKFYPWLCRIAINHCIDMQKSQRLQTVDFHEIDQLSMTNEQTPESAYIQKEFASEMREMLDALPESYRLVLLLRYSNDLSYQEISDILGIRVSTIQVKLHRAKQKLRANTMRCSPKGWSV